MISLSTAVAFGVLAFSMALSPGPNLMYLASRAICQGYRAGFSSLAGVCTGMMAYVVVTALGLSAIFDTVPLAYDVVRTLGALYLVWLAIKAFRTPSRQLATSEVAPEPFAVLFRRGLFTCILNPKLVLMYGALLPQFVQVEQGNVLCQTVQLGLLQVIAAACAHSCVILGASRVAAIFRKASNFAQLQRYILGFSLLAVAAKLGLERRPA
ncbi:threonine/homoserine/homoserine lactone efflux protein [Bradyrhizobium sp. AZCC 1578]|uniref:LysE family translocator n=1 Tax=Bradyrhizobium sp. AZCC 1578 TaxID=3117027 RepID=UPI002FF11173